MTEQEKRIAHLDPLEMRRVATGVTRYWNFSFQHYGWAIFTVNDATGEFSIQSDWGNYSHRWNPKHLGGGQTLLEFVATAEPDYITRKFAYEKPDDFKNEFSPEQTITAIRRHIEDTRTYFYLDCKKKDLLLEQLEKWGKDELAGVRDFDEASHCFHDEERTPEELREFLECPWEFFQGTESYMFLMVRERLLPFFQNYLKTEVLPSKGARQCPEARAQQTESHAGQA